MAVNLSSKIRQNASRLVEKLINSRAGYKWVPDDNLHVTLNFVGDVPENEVADLCRDVKKQLEGTEQFTLTVQGIGAFPTTDEPRTIWLGVTEGAEDLIAINDTIAQLLEAWRFPKDRNAFHPHITLGRLKRGGRWNQALTDLIASHEKHDVGTCLVEEVVVNSSYLDKSGPTYTPMTRIKLS